MSQYHYLVAGLPDISIDDSKLQQSYTMFIEVLMKAFIGKDADLLRIFRLDYDNRNLLAWIKNKDAEFHPLGVVSPSDLQEQIELLDYDNRPPLTGIPAYFLPFLREWKAEQIEEDKEQSRLSELYYEQVLSAQNVFVRNWFEFELNLNNVLTALNCRQFGLPTAEHILGSNEVAELLRTSSLRDFSMSESFPLINDLLSINEEENMLLREKKIDELVWHFLDEQCLFHYFSAEKLLAYLIKLKSLERWISLDPKTGEDRFRSLLAELRSNAHIPA